MRSCALSLLVATCCLATHSRSEDNWPQFRGPGSRGVAVSEAAGLPERWTVDENVLWKTDLPGRGWSSPIVWGDRVFLTAVINTGESEEPKKGLYFGGDRPKPPESPHQWKVYCLELSTGEIVWERLAHEGAPVSSIHLKNSYASETPVTDGKRLYVLFGNVGLFCYDLEGGELWTRPLPARKTRLGWGTAASPALHEGRLYVVHDNEEESNLECLAAETGEELWHVARDEKSNWATPFVWKNELRTEIVTPGTGKTRSYDLEGNLLYELSGMSSITIATPYASHGLLYVSSGYVLDKQRPLLALKPGAMGDISLADDATSNEFIAWSQKDAAPYNPTTIVYGDFLYVLLDRGFFACYDARTGRQVYDRQRLPEGQAFTSSPWAYRDRIFCLNEDGKTFVLQAGPEFNILHTNDLAGDDMCMATPAIAGDKLVLRTAARVYCLHESPQASDSSP